MTIAARLVPILLACWLASQADASSAATKTAGVSANIVKPLTVASLQDLDLGTIMLGLGTWSGAQVSLSRAGLLTCPGPNVSCSGVTAVARYKLTGTNKQVVTVNAPNVIMTNLNDPTKTLTLVVDSPGQVTMTSSGNPGVEFMVGGSISLSSSTATGDYSGTFNITVDYQ
jgi:hypothetical protein